jgi:hypothetical protein
MLCHYCQTPTETPDTRFTDAHLCQACATALLPHKDKLFDTIWTDPRTGETRPVIGYNHDPLSELRSTLNNAAAVLENVQCYAYDPTLSPEELNKRSQDLFDWFVALMQDHGAFMQSTGQIAPKK